MIEIFIILLAIGVQLVKRVFLFSSTVLCSCLPEVKSIVPATLGQTNAINLSTASYATLTKALYSQYIVETVMRDTYRLRRIDLGSARK